MNLKIMYMGPIFCTSYIQMCDYLIVVLLLKMPLFFCISWWHTFEYMINSHTAEVQTHDNLVVTIILIKLCFMLTNFLARCQDLSLAFFHFSIFSVFELWLIQFYRDDFNIKNKISYYLWLEVAVSNNL